MSDRIRSWLRWETGLALVVVIIGIVGASVSSEFFTSNNIFNLGLSYGEIAIMTLPMTLIVISGEIDLSVASILGMSSALLGYLWARHWPMLGIFLLVAVVGLAAGAINGLLVTRLGLPSLAVTIGTEHPSTGEWDASLVTAPFKSGDATIGTIGVVGPTRMDYLSAMASVRAVAQRLSELATEIGQ